MPTQDCDELELEQFGFTDEKARQVLMSLCDAMDAGLLREEVVPVIQQSSYKLNCASRSLLKPMLPWVCLHPCFCVLAAGCVLRVWL